MSSLKSTVKERSLKLKYLNFLFYSIFIFYIYFSQFCLKPIFFRHFFCLWLMETCQLCLPASVIYTGRWIQYKWNGPDDRLAGYRLAGYRCPNRITVNRYPISIFLYSILINVPVTKITGSVRTVHTVHCYRYCTQILVIINVR